MTVFKLSMFTTLIACAIGLVPVRASAETFTATATIKPAAGAAASATLTATVEKFAGDADRKALLAAVGKGGTAARDLLAKRPNVGSILVAASEQGVCAIFMGDDPEALARDLQHRFPKADLIGGDRDFQKTVAKVVGLVEAPGGGLDLPLDLRGTAFQQRVWQALRKIPAGKTATYTEIAKRIGHPKAVRAVAQACAGNPIAVAIPCHRVVRLDGGLSGYRWGVARKRALLDKEAAA